MWPWHQQPTSSAHPHYPSSYHHLQSHITSPHALPVHPQPQYSAGGQRYIYTSQTPTREFSPYPPHMSSHMPVGGVWSDQQQNNIQSESGTPLPFSSPIPHSEVHHFLFQTTSGGGAAGVDQANRIEKLEKENKDLRKSMNSAKKRRNI